MVVTATTFMFRGCRTFHMKRAQGRRKEAAAMQGAREYVDVFGVGPTQYGKLVVFRGYHARGATLRVFVLKDEAPVVNIFAAEAVEVYGIIDGQPGWTERYGWKHKGPWQEDFERIVFEMREKNRKEEKERELQRLEREKGEAAKVRAILEAYKANTNEVV